MLESPARSLYIQAQGPFSEFGQKVWQNFFARFRARWMRSDRKPQYGTHTESAGCIHIVRTSRLSLALVPSFGAFRSVSERFESTCPPHRKAASEFRQHSTRASLCHSAVHGNSSTNGVLIEGMISRKKAVHCLQLFTWVYLQSNSQHTFNSSPSARFRLLWFS